jgi:PAS domain S-box-containing protein
LSGDRGISTWHESRGDLMNDLFDSSIAIPEEMQAVTRQRAAASYRSHSHSVAVRVDRLFALIMVVQWIAAIVAALTITPLTWVGPTSSVHFHVISAVVIGGCLCLPPVVFALTSPGARINCYLISACQVLFSGLMIHLTGGRIETHFHIFASLAFLALYREWQVLIPATMVTAIDHLLRGSLWPEFVFGITSPSSWRWLEHVAWVLCEDAVLVTACVQTQKETKTMANQMAHLSVTKMLVETEVRTQIMEIHKATEDLRNSERRTRQIIDSAHDAFCAMNSHGILTAWSKRAEATFGWTAEDAVGQPLGPLLGIVKLSTLLISRQQSESPCREHFNTVVRHRCGDMIHTEVYVSFVKIGDEHTIDMFFHDITEQRRLQVQLLHSNKMESIGQLAAGIAHEINTPTQYATDNLRFVQDSMNHLTTLFECLSDDSLDRDEGVCHLRQIAVEADLDYLRAEIPLAICQALDGIQRIGEITKAMKEFSHPGTDIKQITDLHHLILNSVTVCRNEWKYAAVVETNFDPSVEQVACLPGELSQVFVNLIVNAAQAIGEPMDSKDLIGRITISTRHHGDAVSIEIQDNGPGIPDDVMGRIFDPFFTTKEIGKGTGQGLAIAHTVIVDKHGGSISVDSELGKGTTFTILLPMVDPVTPAEDRR